jgi:hypothetical protein
MRFLNACNIDTSSELEDDIQGGDNPMIPRIMEALIENRALLQGKMAREDILSATKTHNLDDTTDMFRAANSCV